MPLALSPSDAGQSPRHASWLPLTAALLLLASAAVFLLTQLAAGPSATSWSVVTLRAAAAISAVAAAIAGLLSVFLTLRRLPSAGQTALVEEMRLDRDQLQAILQNTADGITVQDMGGHLVYANNAAALLVGYPSAEALIAAPLEEIDGRFLVLDEAGQPVPPERWPGRSVLRGEAQERDVMHFRLRDSGEDRWSVVRAAPIRDPGGEVVFAITATQDITELMRGEIRLRLLADARALLASELDFEATLAAVSRLAVPEFADCAVVDLVGMDGTVRRLAAACSDPAKEQRVHELQQRYPPSSEAPIGAGWIGGAIEPLLVEEVTDDVLGQQAINPEHLGLLRELGLHSTIVVPLRARGLLLGAMAFAMAESGRRYRLVDLTLAHELAGMAALAVDNARLFRDAQEALRQRDRVLTSVSHDLRTPLTTIRGMLQVLTRRANPDTLLFAPQVLERLSLADRAAAQMGTLIDEILDLAHLEDGRPLELHPQRTELVNLVRRVVEHVEEVRGWHRIGVETNLVELYGICDGHRLERALVSLLDNAAQFSPEGSPIAVRIRGDDGDGRRISWCEITVSDRGAGIAPELQPHLFERHYGRTSHGRAVDRGNVGLFGSLKIIQAHGGTLTVESQEGEGSTFRIRLPIEDLEND